MVRWFLPFEASLLNQYTDNLVQTQSNDDTPDIELTDDDLLLTPSVVFGFSLADKVWREFYFVTSLSLPTTYPSS